MGRIIESLRQIPLDHSSRRGLPNYCFGTYRYRYESGHGGNAQLASFAPRAAHLVLYLIGGYADEHAQLLARLGPHKSGKSCLYIKRLGDIDLDVLRELIDRSVESHRRQDHVSAG